MANDNNFPIVNHAGNKLQAVVGEHVWFIGNNQIQHCEITQIIIYSGYIEYYVPAASLKGNDDKLGDILIETNIFRQKDLLIDSL